jgi:hypothetical protein
MGALDRRSRDDAGAVDLGLKELRPNARTLMVRNVVRTGKERSPTQSLTVKDLIVEQELVTSKKDRRKRRETQFESAGAEFLVLGQLLIRNIPTYKTYLNVAGYDLAATNPTTNRLARIQVKSRWATDLNKFSIKVETCDLCDFVVLVPLNRGYDFTKSKKELPASDPQYYIFPSNSAKNFLKMSRQGSWIPWPLRDENPENYRDKWTLIEEFLKKSAGRVSER